jgi:hypothetical protein
MMRREDFDSSSDVSTDLAVVRWGRVWRAFDKPSAERGSDGATIGPAHPSKAVAIAYCLRLIEKGDYR